MRTTGYNDHWVYLNKFIDLKCRDSIPNLKIYFVEIVETDGYIANVKIVGNSNLKSTIDGVPILQSKYNHPITQMGDKGLLLNLQQNISAYLFNKTQNEKIKNSSFFVFLPLICNDDYNSDNLTNTISSPDLESTIKLNDEGLVIDIKQNVSILSGNISLETKENGGVVITTDGDGKIDLNSKEIQLNGKDKVNLETTELTLSSKNPIEIKTNESLGSLLSELCNELSSFKTLPVANGSPAMPDPSFITNITKIATKLKQVLK